MPAFRLRADRRPLRILAVVAGVLLLLLLVLAAFPWGAARSLIAARLSHAVGRPVTIGAVERLDAMSLDPTVVVRDVRVPQPAWAGAGDLARVATVQVRFRALPLLIGRFEPTAVRIDGLRLALRRDADRRENWHQSSQRGGGSRSFDLSALTISDAHVVYDDAFQQRRFDLALRADRSGVAIDGPGTVRGTPVTVRVRAPAVGSAATPWPFRVAIEGPALHFRLAGIMDRALDTQHLAFDVRTRAADLKLVDALIEAGLFGTQPVVLAAQVRHDAAQWQVSNLRGSIGRSDLTGHLAVVKHDGRTQLTGAVAFGTLDFDDFASDAGHARARALTARIGPRLVPNTRINLAHLGKTDATIRVSAHRLASAQPSSLADLSGTLHLDHQRVTVDDLRIGLSRGLISGHVAIDQRDGRSVPTLTLDLRLAGSTVGAVAGGGGSSSVDGQLQGRVKLSGAGSTVREAVGRSGGTIGIVARDGSLPAVLASKLGFDAGRALTTDSDARSGLRCAVARFVLHDGAGRAAPFLIDTTRSRMDGAGTLRFPDEALDLRLTGAPKKDSLLRLPGSATITGTIKAPEVTVPKEVKSVGNIFKAIGRAITGHQGPLATNADCGALTAQVMGN